MDYEKMGGKQEDILFLKLKPERFIFIFTWLSGHVSVDIITISTATDIYKRGNTAKIVYESSIY